MSALKSSDELFCQKHLRQMNDCKITALSHNAVELCSAGIQLFSIQIMKSGHSQSQTRPLGVKIGQYPAAYRKRSKNIEHLLNLVGYHHRPFRPDVRSGQTRRCNPAAKSIKGRCWSNRRQNGATR